RPRALLPGAPPPRAPSPRSRARRRHPPRRPRASPTELTVACAPPRLARMQTSLAQFAETQSQDAFALQNQKLLKVRLDQVTVQAKLGSMVAYQGEVSFEHAGSGG